MEGDKPTGCLVLVKYVQLKTSMEARLKRMHQNDPLFPMVDIMIDKIISYLNEALECDTLILAAVFHPGLRVKFFDHTFGNGSEGKNRAEELLKLVFTQQRDQMELNNPLTPAPTRSNSPEDEGFGSTSLNFYNEVVTSSELDEVDRYLQGIDPMGSSDMNDPQSVLDWWKVSLVLLIIYFNLF